MKDRSPTRVLRTVVAVSLIGLALVAYFVSCESGSNSSASADLASSMPDSERDTTRRSRVTDVPAEESTVETDDGASREARAVWLHDGTPARNIALCVSHGDRGDRRETRLNTDQRGVVRIPRGVSPAQIASRDSSVVVFASQSGAETQLRLLIARSVEIEVTVTATDLDPGELPSGLTVSLERLDVLELSPDLQSVEGFTKAELVAADVPMRWRLDVDPATGRATERVSAIDHLVARASAFGYVPTVAELDVVTHAFGTPLRVHLTLSRSREISGRVVGPDGEPVAGVPISITSWRRLATEGMDLAKYGGLTARASVGIRGVSQTHSIVTVRTYATSEADGSWRSEIVFDGTIEVVGFATSRSPARAGVAWSQLDDVQLRVGPLQDTSVQLLHDGAPIAEAAVVIVDLSSEDQTGSPNLQTDKTGRVSSTFLVHGRHYYIRARRAEGSHRVFVDWEGQSSITFE